MWTVTFFCSHFFLVTKKYRGFRPESTYRFLCLHSHPLCQHGYSRVYSGIPKKGPMGYFHRPFGRVFPIMYCQLDTSTLTFWSIGFYASNSFNLFLSESTSRFFECGQVNWTNYAVDGNTYPVHRRLVEPGYSFELCLKRRYSPLIIRLFG